MPLLVLLALLALLALLEMLALLVLLTLLALLTMLRCVLFHLSVNVQLAAASSAAIACCHRVLLSIPQVEALAIALLKNQDLHH